MEMLADDCGAGHIGLPPRGAGEAHVHKKALSEVWTGRKTKLGYLVGFEPTTSWATTKRSNQTEL